MRRGWRRQQRHLRHPRANSDAQFGSVGRAERGSIGYSAVVQSIAGSVARVSLAERGSIG